MNKFTTFSAGIDVEMFREKLYTDEKPGPNTPGSPGSALADGLVPSNNEVTIIKKRFSAFMFTNLDSILRRLGSNHVVICGVQTPNCIRQTAFDALGFDYKVTVLSDATASASQNVQDSNLRDMRNVNIATPTVDEWAASIPPPKEENVPIQGKKDLTAADDSTQTE